MEVEKAEEIKNLSITSILFSSFDFSYIPQLPSPSHTKLCIETDWKNELQIA